MTSPLHQCESGWVGGSEGLRQGLGEDGFGYKRGWAGARSLLGAFVLPVRHMGASAATSCWMFLGVLFGLLFFERASNALVRVLLYLLSGRNSKRGVAGMQLLQGAINSLVGLVLFLVSLPLQALSGLGQWALTVLTWISVAATIFLVYQFSGHVLIAITDMWNGGLGPSAQVLFVWPTAIINYVFKAVIPLWNAGIWLWKKVPAQILVRTVTYNLGLVISAAEAAAAFAEASAESVVAWVGAFVCCDVPDGFCNTNCLDAGTRVLDLIGPMGAIRAVVLFVAEWLKQMCGRLSGPIDFLTYGFMDLNLAEGVHFLLNAGHTVGCSSGVRPSGGHIYLHAYMHTYIHTPTPRVSHLGCTRCTPSRTRQR